MSKEVTIIKVDKETTEYVEFLLERKSINNYLSEEDKELILNVIKAKDQKIERLNKIKID